MSESLWRFKLLLCLLLLWACTALASPLSAATPLQMPMDAAALVPGASLEQKRYLLYLYARVNNPKMAEFLANQILRDNPGDKQTLLVLASMHIERQEAEKALLAGKTLVQFFPDDHQAIYFLAAAHFLARQYSKANEMFHELKIKQFRGKLYPYETDLASSALQAGDWSKAMLSYQTLLREHSLSEELRFKNRQVLERIYREHLPELTVSENGFLLRNGLVFRSTVAHRQHLTDSHRVLFQYSRQDVRVDEAPDLVPRWSANHDVQLGLETVFSKRWKTTSWIGGTETGLRGSFSAVRTLGDQRAVEFRFDGNQRSDDGLLLQSLDGRQNRLSVNMNWALSQSWHIHGQIYGRELVLDQQQLGYSHGGTFQFERIVFHETPDLRLGYHAAWMNYSSKNRDTRLIVPAIAPGTSPAVQNNILSNLVLGELHRQGIHLEYRDQLSGALHYRTGASVDYDVVRASMEYSFNTGFSFYPRRSIELKSDAVYSSSASTIDQGSDVWQFIVSLKYWF